MLKQQTFKFLDFGRFVGTRFLEDRCTQVAASLTFTTLLSLAPLITVAVVLFAAFPAFSGFSTQIKIYLLTHMAPEAAGKIISVYMQQFSDNAARLTAAGLVFLGVTAIMLMFTIDKALNAIWRVPKPRPLIQRVVIYWAVLTLGPLLIGASLSLTSWLVSSSMGFAEQVPGGGQLLLKTVPVVLTTIAYTLLFVVVPNRTVPVPHAFTGALVAAVIFEASKSAFASYISHFPAYKLVYGAFAAIPIFLVWVYLSWLVVLLGAEVAAALSNWSAGTWRTAKTAGRDFVNALRLLRVLVEHHKTGTTADLKGLRRRLGLGMEELEALLRRLAGAGWVAQAAGSRWVLARDPGEIQVADVYRLFVMDPRLMPGALDEAGLAALLEPLEKPLDSELCQSLAECFAVPKGGAEPAPLHPAEMIAAGKR